MAEAPEPSAGFADDYFVEAAAKLELSLKAQREQFLAGASLDLLVAVRNPDLFGEQRIPAPVPGNFALSFRVERLGAGGTVPSEVGSYDDSSRLQRSGVPFDTDAKGYAITLEPEEEREARFDLLGYAGPLAPGSYRVTAVLEAELLEASCELEVIPPAAVRAAREAWDYGRGPDSDGFCLWSSEDPREGIAGTYLTVRAPHEPSLALSARKLSRQVAPEGLAIAPSPLYRADVRHACWPSEAGLAVVRVRGGHAEAAWELPERLAALSDDPQGGLLGLRLLAGDGAGAAAGPVGAEGAAGPGAPGAAGAVELVRLASRAAPRLDAEGLPEPQPATWEPVASFPAPPDARLALWVSCYGPVFVGILAPSGLRIARWAPPADALGTATLSETSFAFQGEPRWLALFQGPSDEEGSQAQAYCLLATPGDQGALLRCVPGAPAASDDYPPGVEPLATGELPPEELHDALLGGGRLHLLIRRDATLQHLPFPGIARDLDPGRYAPAWTQLVQSSPEGGQKLYLRGRAEGALSYDELGT